MKNPKEAKEVKDPKEAKGVGNEASVGQMAEELKQMNAMLQRMWKVQQQLQVEDGREAEA